MTASEELWGRPIGELARLLRERALSPVELTRAHLDRIDRLDPVLRAYITVDHDDALNRAKQAEQEIGEGRARGALHGIPIGLKDNLYVAGRVTTMGSTVHRDFVPDDSATVVERLTDAGAVFLGKLNLHEYALGGTTNNRVHGTCRNPWDPERSPGGSSGGSAVAVAAGLAAAALGSDTSGSIRVPAAMCGVVGFKGSYGRVSTRGCFPEAWSLDHVGPLTRTVTDAALVFDAISGHDGRDPASLDLPPTETATMLSPRCRGVVLGMDEEASFQDVDPAIEDCVRAAIRGLEDLGAQVAATRLPDGNACDEVLDVIDAAEAAAVHRDTFRERPDDFAEDVRPLLRHGLELSAVDYVAAGRRRQALRQDVQRVFEEVDLVVTPMVPVRTPRIGESHARVFASVTLASLFGLPCLSVPCGLVEGMPVGLQIIGPPLSDQRVLDAGRAVEELGLFAPGLPDLP